jgi:hypothetical protein
MHEQVIERWVGDEGGKPIVAQGAPPGFHFIR